MSASRAKLRRRSLLIAGGVAAASVLLGALAWMPAGADLHAMIRRPTVLAETGADQ